MRTPTRLGWIVAAILFAILVVFVVFVGLPLLSFLLTPMTS